MPCLLGAEIDPRRILIDSAHHQQLTLKDFCRMNNLTYRERLPAYQKQAKIESIAIVSGLLISSIAGFVPPVSVYLSTFEYKWPRYQLLASYCKIHPCPISAEHVSAVYTLNFIVFLICMVPIMIRNIPFLMRSFPLSWRISTFGVKILGVLLTFNAFYGNQLGFESPGIYQNYVYINRFDILHMFIACAFTALLSNLMTLGELTMVHYVDRQQTLVPQGPNS